MQLAASVVIALSFLLATRSVAGATCDPTTEPDKSDIANARAQIATDCACAQVVKHGTYVHCAGVNAANLLANKDCRGEVTKCESRSTCGRPGFETCCRTTHGRTKCSIKRTGRCHAPQGGSACTGTFASCCDACTNGGCAGTTTSSITTSTTSSITTTTAQCSVPGPCGGVCPPFGGQCEPTCGGAALVCVSLTGFGPMCSTSVDCPPTTVCIHGSPSSPCSPGFCEPVCP